MSTNQRFALFNYHPKVRRLNGVRRLNPEHDNLSRTLLELKDGHGPAIAYIARQLHVWLDDDVNICLVPPSDPANTNSGMKRVAECLAEISSRQNLSAALIRTHQLRASHLCRSGRPGLKEHLSSLRVIHPELVQGKAIVLLDDICTTGTSLRAAERALSAAGASAVQWQVVAETFDYSGRYAARLRA